MMRNLKMTLQYEGKEFVLDKLLIEIDESIVALEEQAAYKQHYDDAKKVACIMVTTMVLELQKFYEDYWPYEILLDIARKFHKKARQERYKVVKALIACKLKDGESVRNHVQRVHRYME